MHNMGAPRAKAIGDDPDLTRWIEELGAQRRSKFTVKHYGIMLRSFQSWLHNELGANIPLRRAGASDLKQYQIWLSTRKRYSKNTLYINIKAIQAFYRFLQLPQATELKPPRRSQSLPKYLTEPEATRLIAAAPNTRVRAQISLLLYGGFRVGELCALLVPDIDFDEGTIRVRSGKGDKDRLVVVPPKCMVTTQEWLAARQKSQTDYLFQGKGGRRAPSSISVQRAVVKTARAAGLEKRVTPHVLRHTLATTLLRRGGDIRFIQRILGHASIATTQIYTHLDDAELKRMYEKARPDF